MSMTIISCPSCDTILLADTVQCPSCKHVLQPERFAEMAAALEEQEADDAPTELPCPACGEGVRPGLVRCFNCGTYLNDEAAQSHLQMQASSYLAERSPGGFAGSALPDDIPLAPDDSYARYGGEETTIAEDDDFEISPAYTLRAPTVHLETYSLAIGGQAEAPAGAPPVAGGTVAVAPPGAAGPGAATAEAGAFEAAADAGAAPPAAATDAASGEESHHSVATAGDVLLKIALDEEESAAARRGGARGRRRGAKLQPRSRGGVIVYCPNGHRIEAQQKHRGLMGRCRKCKMPFFVPNLELPAPGEAAAAGSTSATDAVATEPGAAAVAGPAPTAVAIGGLYWLADMPLHSVNPAKVKAKPGCLQKSFQAVDLGLRPEGLLVVTLVKPGGLFGLGGKKPEPARQAVRTHLAEGKPLSELPAPAQQEYATDALSNLTLVQPAPAGQSPFGDVPVFGEGRIAVKLPDVGEAPEKQFLSFSLSQFREFVGLIRSICGIAAFAENAGVPLTETFSELTCHYSEAKLQSLDDVPYYQADAAYKLEVIGRKCAECGLVVSEDARKKEKIGGLDGKGIAKAKCPKCQKKFGSVSIFTLAAK